MSFNCNQKKVIYIIFFLALVLRLGYVLFFPQIEVKADAARYDRLAWSIALGGGYLQEIGRPPLFPFFLAGIYMLFGHSFFVVRIVQAIVSSFTCILVYLVGKRVFDEKIGFLSGLLAVFYPAFISYTGLLLTETIATFLIIVFLYFLMKAVEYKNQRRWNALAGLVLGLVILCRSEMLLLPLFVLPGLLLIYNSKKQALIGFFILSSLAAIIILPWTVRNYVSFHKFIPVTVGFGRTLWLGSYPEEWTKWHYDREPLKSLKCKTAVEFDTKLRKLAFENITTHPFIYLKLCIKKFFRFWLTSHSNTFKGLREAFINVLGNLWVFFPKLLLLILNLSLILSGFYGIFLSIKRHLNLCLILILVIAYKVILHTILFSAPRYQLLVMPYIIILAVYAWDELFKHNYEKLTY